MSLSLKSYCSFFYFCFFYFFVLDSYRYYALDIYAF